MSTNPFTPKQPGELYASVLRTMQDSYEEELHLLQQVDPPIAQKRRTLLREAIAAIQQELRSREAVGRA